jgi:trimethylamine--corrinoid protein Co-methyltransferase
MGSSGVMEEPRKLRRRIAQQQPRALRQVPYKNLRHPYSPQTIWSEDEVSNIHATALRVIEELGIRILLPEARELLVAAGAIERADMMIHIGADVVAEALRTAPRSFRLNAPNPANNILYEPGAMLFKAGAGCPNATDLESGRRPGSLNDFRNALMLQQSFDVIHSLGPSAEPQDVPINLRHYAITNAQLEVSDKLPFIYSRGRGQVLESFEMLQLACNLTQDEFEGAVYCTTVINSNSPRLLDKPMAQGIIDFARAGQLAIITPFCLAGAMAPVTVAGALLLQHAEALACITLSQIARPGTPVSYGGFSSNVDMKSGAPAFGTPEHVQMQIGSGQLARYIDLPWRSASGSASNTADMQAATENNMALWGSLMANATLTIHAAGWQEGGLSFGFEKFINDIEALQIIAELCHRPSGSGAELAWDAIADVQPGGHFFATQHTMDRFETAFYQPLVADLSNFGQWTDAGSRTSTERATAIWKSCLRDFKSPAQAGERVERIAQYIETKSAKGGASPLD